MTTVHDVFSALCAIAPLSLQMDFDNSGFLFGHADRELHRVLLALDVTDEVVEEALRLQAELIVSHHPLIFHPLKSMTDQSPEGRRLLKLAENRIAVISMHTNLDIAEGGVNDVLMDALGVKTEGFLEEPGLGRIGVLDAKIPMQSFLARCREALDCRGLRYVDAGKPVYRVAVMGGSGADSLERAAELGCDTYVTADVKYHQFQRALELSLNLIDADHFSTENPVIPVLAEKLGAAFPEVRFLVSEVHQPIIRFA